MQPDDALLTTRQVAAMLSMQPATVRKWVRFGKIPNVKINGAVRYRRAEIAEWLEINARPVRSCSDS